METQLVKQNNQQALLQTIWAQTKSSIAKITSGASKIQRDRFDAIVFSLLRQPDLASCTLESLQLAVLDIYKIGLDPDRNKKLIYVIPFKDRETRKKIATIMIGVYGYIELMYKAGLTNIIVMPVYENDEFDLLTTADGTTYTHKPYAVVGKKESGGVKGVLVSAMLPEGKNRIDFYAYDKLIKAKASAQTTKVWDKWEDEMLRKTAAKLFAKYIRLSPEMQYAIAIDTLNESADTPQEIISQRSVEIAEFKEIPVATGNGEPEVERHTTRRTRRRKPPAEKPAPAKKAEEEREQPAAQEAAPPESKPEPEPEPQETAKKEDDAEMQKVFGQTDNAQDDFELDDL